MAAESPSHEGPEPADTDSGAVAHGEDGQDDLKDKFQEALERKRAKQAQAAALAAHNGASKIRGAHGPAASRRSFRRKSGG